MMCTDDDQYPRSHITPDGQGDPQFDPLEEETWTSLPIGCEFSLSKHTPIC